MERTVPVRTARLHQKKQATFSDTIVPMRRWLWSAESLSMSEKPHDMIDISRELFERLTDMLSYPA